MGKRDSVKQVFYFVILFFIHVCLEKGVYFYRSSKFLHLYWIIDHSLHSLKRQKQVTTGNT